MTESNGSSIKDPEESGSTAETPEPESSFAGEIRQEPIEKNPVLRWIRNPRVLAPMTIAVIASMFVVKMLTENRN